jgi:sugar lactone lactonase YvrE
LCKVTAFYDGLDHPECVAVHPDGSVWAGGEAGQIYRMSSDGKRAEVVAHSGGFILGIAFSPDARWLLACDLKKRCLWRLDLRSRRLRLFSHGIGGHRLSIPNYPVFASDGTLYVSDSGAFRKVNGKVLRFDADHSGRGAVWHAGPFNFANGLALSPKGDALFVVCTWLPGVERIAIGPDGAAGRRTVYARMPKALPDGAAFDQHGNLYVSCYTPARIYKVTPRRKVSILVEDWESHTLCNPTNVAFGGKKHDTLLVSNLGRWHIARIPLKTKGAPLACHRR